MKKFNKILSVVLCLAMVLSMAAFTVSAESESATISFADVANRTSVSTEQQVWEQNGITVTNDKAGSTSNVNEKYYNPVRFYKGSSVTIAYSAMKQITVNCNSASYATALVNSISDANATVTVADKAVTIVFANAVDSFVVAALSAQIRVDSITVYTGEVPEEPIEPEVPEVPENNDPAADSTLTISEAIALGASKEHNTYTEGKYYVAGEIAEVYNTTYGNMKIKDAEGNILTIYGTYSADGADRYDAMEVKPVAGDTVKIYGIIGQYNGTPQIKNGWIVEHTPGGNQPEEPEVPEDPAADSVLTIMEAIALGTSKNHNTYTAGKYYVTGEITEVYNTTYGNMKIKDTEGNILTIYGTYSADGADRYDAMEVKPVAGDTVTVYGIVGQYNGVAQIKNGWITEYVPAEPVCEHVNVRIDGAMDASCEENGFTGNLVCNDCDEVLVIGSAIEALGHSFADGFCTVCGALDPNFVPEEPPVTDGPEDVTITIGDKSYTTVDGKFLYNEDVTMANCTNYNMILLDKDFSGIVETNGWGVAIVLGKDGTLLRVYDGANGGYWTAEGKASSAHFTGQDFAAVAWSELQADELLIIFTNGGSAGNQARQFGLDVRRLCGQTATMQGFIWIEEEEITCHHTNTTIEGAVDATCTEDGYTGNTVCADCGETVITGEVIAALGHAYVDGFCTVCGGEQPPCVHEPVLVDKVDATCVINGYTGDLVCAVCSETIEVGSVVEATGHSYVEGACTVCGESDPDYHPQDHKVQIVVIAPTCTQWGCTLHICTEDDCNKSWTTDYVAAIGHAWVAPTCTEAGYCANCGEAGEAALGHAWVAPTCTEDGYCANCNAAGEAALGHDMIGGENQAPTCTEPGFKSHVCTRCDYSESYETPAMGHVWLDATCICAKTCANCGEKDGEALPHNWNYSVVKEPTCTEQGINKMSCPDCGMVQSYPVAALEHTEEILPAKAPTCTEPGLSEGKKCSVCGEILVAQEEIPVLEHTAGEWVIVKEATETETGLKQQVCTACGKVLAEEVIPVIENQGPADTGNGVVYLFVLAAMAAMSGAAIAVCRKKYF